MSKSLKDFEDKHGQEKIADLQKQLAAETRKVATLSNIQNRLNIVASKERTVRFGLIGDLHIGSLHANEGALQGFFDYMHSQKVTQCFATGDIIEGVRVYKGQEFEVSEVGLEGQIGRLSRLKLAPVPVSFITGNHDASFKNLVGVHVGKAIEQSRKGWTFLGEDQARIQFKSPGRKYQLMLLHPGGGSAYSLSYKTQKIVESLEGGNKPNMLAVGHYHKAEFMPSYRNVSVVQTGTFCRQTPFMARQGLAAHMGGWIMEVTIGATHNIVKSEFVAVY